jgi:hypothetical protein
MESSQHHSCIVFGWGMEVDHHSVARLINCCRVGERRHISDTDYDGSRGSGKTVKV